MQIKLLNDILSHVVGRQASDIVSLLAGKKNVNEFVIAKKLGLTINQARNILYKLSDAGLVSFTRKKDKKKGWYTYFWTLNIERSLGLLEGNVRKETEGLKNQLKNRESRRFFFCNVCKTEVSEETALLHNFTCSECGEVYALQTDKKILSDLASKIKKLENLMAIIGEEIRKAKETEFKKKARREKSENKLKEKQKKKAKKIKNKIKKISRKAVKKKAKKIKKKKIHKKKAKKKRV